MFKEIVHERLEGHLGVGEAKRHHIVVITAGKKRKFSTH
jgi:hypothetical protein